MEKIDLDLDNVVGKETLTVRYRGSVITFYRPYFGNVNICNSVDNCTVGPIRVPPMGTKVSISMDIDCMNFYIDTLGVMSESLKGNIDGEDIEEYFK